jgi:hypothetical protein
MTSAVILGIKKPLYKTHGGFAVSRGNDFGGVESTALEGTFSEAPYHYELLDTSAVRSFVESNAGQTLDF